MIFDEVISGFRCARGGAQQLYGIKPDLTTLAKILAGGYPGAALAGRADVLQVLDYRQENRRLADATRGPSGNVQCGARLRGGRHCDSRASFASTDAIERATRTAAAIRDGINEAIRRRGLQWCAYGQFSDFHLYRGDASPEDIHAGKVSWRLLKGNIPLEIVNRIRAGLLLHGVDIASWPGGLVSAAHN